MVQEGQKWPKCTSTSPVLIIDDKKTTFGGVKILTYFFTRNVPLVKKWVVGKSKNMTVLIQRGFEKQTAQYMEPRNIQINVNPI